MRVAHATATVDLAEARRNLSRLAAVQAGLLLVVVIAWRVTGTLDARVLAWVGLLPVLVTAWGLYYYRGLKRTAESGSDRKTFVAVNKRALGLLAGLGLAWLAGLAAVTVLVLT